MGGCDDPANDFGDYERFERGLGQGRDEARKGDGGGERD